MRLSHLLAPFTPFIADEMYRNLVGRVDLAAPLERAPEPLAASRTPNMPTTSW